MFERKIGFNFNDTIEVTLRPSGEAIHAEAMSVIPEAFRPAPWKAGTMRRMQLWMFCLTFGPHMMIGCDPPVETEAALIRTNL